MAMRDLVTGGAACAVPGSSSSSNPSAPLANAILGSSMKAQDLKGLPESQVTIPDVSSDFGPEAQLKNIPGSEYENQIYQQSNAQTSEFLRGFRAGGRGSLEDAWEEVQQFPLLPNARNRESDVHYAEFEQIFEGGVNGQTFGW
ncbi:hypothetical protein HPP92_017856 [Vanilla planifolia]|uniref:Uncharacterized protein n=1 Tax=Vanilla planifolia TaxID=51239 RepID=A0A835Q8U2_VANPL|nr:hypothetical protein HPP92_017856 [Vanilla planifolia]